MKYESQLQITTAAAVPPLTVNQTALVTNFNADLLDGQHGAYYATAASLSGYLPLTGGTLTGTLTGTIGVFTTVRATELTSLLGSNGPITITPDGTGHVHINSTDIRLGPNNTNATLATRGTGDLILRTNEGSAVEGYIKIFDGANGNIEITPNGTGTVVVGKLSGSTASFSGQITSTVATGTAPFVVTSTTRVNNLNVQYLDGQLSTYYAAASSLASYLPLSGGQMTGALSLHSTGTNGFYNGTGDAATYALYNFKLGGWNGMALENLSTGGTYPSQVVGVIDFRSGTIDMKGGFKVNGASVITENQSITISGDASGTGKTAINLTLANVGTAGTYRSVTTDAKGRVTAGTNPTTLAGYGITDALPITGGTLTGGLSGTTGSFSGALSISGTVQAGFSRLKVLDYNNNGTPTNGIRIATNIPQTSGVGMYTLIFEGYRYGDSNPEMWAVSFYIYNAGAGVVFYNVGGTCWGGKYPSLVQLGWVGGLANIFILTDLVYFRRFTVRAVAGNMSESTSHFEGWSASDSNPTLASATGVVTVPFNNEFGNVAVKGALSSTGAITQAGNQVVHAGNVSTYALPIGGGTLAGNLTINGHLTMGSGYQHRASDGSAAAPGYSFNAETGTGMYRSGTNTLAFATGGVLRASIDGSGNLTATGAVTATNFSGPGTGLTGTAAGLSIGGSAVQLNGQAASYYLNAGNLNAGTLLAARLPAFTGGDVTSTAGTVALTLANSGVTAGTYTKVTVDAKGRVTTGALLASADLPTYTGTITSSQVTTALGFTPYNATNPSGYITNTATITGYSGGISVSDSRAVVTTPQSINMGVVFDFKQNTTEGLSDGGTYFGEMTFRQYGSTTDWSGGLSHQLGFTDNGNVWQRSGSSTTWGAWKKLLDATNFSSHALPLSGGTLTGQLISNSKIETTGVVTGSSFSGAGTGLTGTAASLTAGAVPWTGVTGKPTTLAGYGITDALPLSGGTLTGGLTGTSLTLSSLATLVNSAGTNYNENVRFPRATSGYVSLALACDTSGSGSIAGQFNIIVYPAATSGGAFAIRANGTDALTMTTAGAVNIPTLSGTTGSFSGQITSTVATGTAPLVIASTTLVSNLNAQYLNGQLGSYYQNASNLNAGTVPAAQMPAHTGDVTSTAGSLALTIANDTVTNAKLKTMGAGTIKGNNGAVANSPSDLTAAQVATMLSGQTMNIAGSSASCTGNAATATTSTRLSDASNGLRIANPGGGSYATGASTATGAIKIKLPTASFKSNTMFRFTVKIYQYAGGSSGLSRTIEIGGYNYSDAAANWYNIFAYQNTMGGGELNVRFGNDGTSQCVWIGEIATVWDYPQVTVTDFQGGYSNYTDAIWATGWGITFATAFDTVTQGPIVAAKPINSQNYSSYAPTLTGGGASGTWGINITGSSASCTGNAATSSSCSGNAATASAVAASGITGQTGMWTSAARPGPYRLYRRDVNDAYSVQNYWTGTYWRLDGYYSNDTVHAGCSVAYADTAGSASSASSATNSTQLNGQAASYYENRDTTAVGISAGTLTLTRAAGNLTTTIGGRVVAWCDFNGNFASTQTPNANFNVSSITKNATGDYTVNFSSALANANYVVAGSAQLDAPSPGQSTYNVMVAVPRRSGAKATGSCRIVTEYPLGVTLYDSVSVGVAFIAA